MKRKIIIISTIVLAIILTIIIAGGLVYYNMQNAELQRQANLEKLNGITKEVSELYVGTEKEALKETILQEEIDSILNNIDNWIIENPKEDILNILNEAKTELAVIQEMLDTNNYIKELAVDKAEVMADEVIIEMEEAISVWEERKPLFFTNLTEEIENIKSKNETKKLVYELFSDETYSEIKEELTIDQINTAKEKVETMQESESKNNLNTLVSKAEERWNQIEEEKEAERKKQETLTKSSSSKSSSSSSGSNSSSSNSSNTSSSGSSSSSSGNGTYYGEITPAQLEESRVIAKQIANSIGSGTDLERVRKAAQKVSEYYNRGVHKEEGPYYNSAYGVFIAGESSCAGCTRALGMVLDYMGYNWTHKNRGQWTHQWVVLQMDGQTGWADGQQGDAGYGDTDF